MWRIRGEKGLSLLELMLVLICFAVLVLFSIQRYRVWRVSHDLVLLQKSVVALQHLAEIYRAQQCERLPIDRELLLSTDQLREALHTDTFFINPFSKQADASFTVSLVPSRKERAPYVRISAAADTLSAAQGLLLASRLEATWHQDHWQWSLGLGQLQNSPMWSERYAFCRFFSGVCCAS